MEVALVALYLRGGPRRQAVRRAGWPEVVKALRNANVSLAEFPDALREATLYSEALVIEDRTLLDWASSLVDYDRTLTAVSPNYPGEWVRTLGSSAPPALWRDGAMPEGPCLSIVGSRTIDGATRRFCVGVGAEASRLGYVVVSGRAAGCDAAAVKEADRFVEIVPHGLMHVRPGRRDCLLSACPYDELFSSAAAMERNTLIYAASSHTIIGRAKFKEGGTWTAATNAVRMRLCRLIVRDDRSTAHKALVGLGATPLERAADLSAALEASPLQGKLFEAAG